MCFMAIKSEKEIQSLDDVYIPSYGEFCDVFKSLYDEFKKLESIYSSLKKIQENLKNKNNDLLEKYDRLT